MSIELTVVTPEGQAFHGPVVSVVLPGTEGDFGVLEGHEVFLTGLRIGEMQVAKEDGEKLFAALSSGFAEVHGNEVTVMVGSCEFAHEIDFERAEVARERALRQLEEMRSTGADEEACREFQEAYSKAIARVSVSKRS